MPRAGEDDREVPAVGFLPCLILTASAIMSIAWPVANGRKTELLSPMPVPFSNGDWPSSFLLGLREWMPMSCLPSTRSSFEARRPHPNRDDDPPSSAGSACSGAGLQPSSGNPLPLRMLGRTCRLPRACRVSSARLGSLRPHVACMAGQGVPRGGTPWACGVAMAGSGFGLLGCLGPGSPGASDGSRGLGGGRLCSGDDRLVPGGSPGGGRATGCLSTPLAGLLHGLCVAVARRGSASRASRLRGCLMPADAVAGAFWPCHGNGAGSVTGVGRESVSSARTLGQRIWRDQDVRLQRVVTDWEDPMVDPGSVSC